MTQLNLGSVQLNFSASSTISGQSYMPIVFCWSIFMIIKVLSSLVSSTQTVLRNYWIDNSPWCLGNVHWSIPKIVLFWDFRTFCETTLSEGHKAIWFPLFLYSYHITSITSSAYSTPFGVLVLGISLDSTEINRLGNFAFITYYLRAVFPSLHGCVRKLPGSEKRDGEKSEQSEERVKIYWAFCMWSPVK